MSVKGEYAYTYAGAVRCANGQSAVGETADQDGGGNVPAGAVTEVDRDLYCVNEDSLSPAWIGLGAYAELWKESPVTGERFVCARADALAYTTTARRVHSPIVENRCGYGNYFALGQHVYARSGQGNQAYWTITPLAWND